MIIFKKNIILYKCINGLILDKSYKSRLCKNSFTKLESIKINKISIKNIKFYQKKFSSNYLCNLLKLFKLYPLLSSPLMIYTLLFLYKFESNKFE